MKETTVTLNKDLTSTLSARIAHAAGKFSSEIKIEARGRSVDAKSIMGVMVLLASKGNEVKIIAEGEDAVIAVETLEQELNQ